jgi:hypothetical protein
MLFNVAMESKAPTACKATGIVTYKCVANHGLLNPADRKERTISTIERSSSSFSGMAKCSAMYGLGLACFAVAVAMAGATQFTVGGSNGWSVPPAGAESLNAWATKNRFQIGDKLGN